MNFGTSPSQPIGATQTSLPSGDVAIVAVSRSALGQNADSDLLAGPAIPPHIMSKGPALAGLDFRSRIARQTTVVHWRSTNLGAS